MKNPFNDENDEAIAVKNKESVITKDEMKKVMQQIQEMYLHSESLGINRNALDEKCALIINDKSKGCKKVAENSDTNSKVIK